MSDAQIPYGYKRVFNQLQKGDGILDLAAGKFIKVKRVPTEVIIRKTKMLYPCVPPTSGTIAIRKCTVEQTELLPAAGDRGDSRPATVETMELE